MEILEHPVRSLRMKTFPHFLHLHASVESSPEVPFKNLTLINEVYLPSKRWDGWSSQQVDKSDCNFPTLLTPETATNAPEPRSKLVVCTFKHLRRVVSSSFTWMPPSAVHNSETGQRRTGLWICRAIGELGLRRFLRTDRFNLHSGVCLSAYPSVHAFV